MGYEQRRREKLGRRVDDVRGADGVVEGEQRFDVGLCDVVSVGLGEWIQTVGGKGGSDFDVILQAPSSEGVVEVGECGQKQGEGVLVASAAEDGGAHDDGGDVGGRVVGQNVVSQPGFSGEDAG